MQITRYPGLSAFTLSALLALAVMLWNYVADVGIAGTGGAALALFGTFALTAAGILLVMTRLPGWARVTFKVLIALGLIGTSLAAFFLHAWIVLALLIVATVAFVISLIL
ncbi:hypothetical protein J4E08_20175 [Sagittula sp. NFXS13]|uniref:hypothetical protein n=1 Tax=Sagittula sp. NFXS13 TaxID=2819095 RepID=UPI0032DF794C